MQPGEFRLGHCGLLVVTHTAVDRGRPKETLNPSSVGGLGIEGEATCGRVGAISTNTEPSIGVWYRALGPAPELWKPSQSAITPEGEVD